MIELGRNLSCPSSPLHFLATDISASLTVVVTTFEWTTAACPSAYSANAFAYISSGCCFLPLESVYRFPSASAVSTSIAIDMYSLPGMDGRSSLHAFSCSCVRSRPSHTSESPDLVGVPSDLNDEGTAPDTIAPSSDFLTAASDVYAIGCVPIDALILGAFDRLSVIFLTW